MPKKREKMLDPQWMADHRKDRHRLKTAVTVRVPPAMKGAWHDAATQSGMTLAAWVVAACTAYLTEGERKVAP